MPPVGLGSHDLTHSPLTLHHPALCNREHAAEAMGCHFPGWVTKDTDFRFTFLLARFWVTHSRGASCYVVTMRRQPTAHREGLGPPANSEVSEPLWKQIVQSSCMQTPESL